MGGTGNWNIFRMGLAIILLIYLFSHARAAPAISCPKECTCDETNITCAEKDLETIPQLKTISTYPKTIDLSANDIEEVGPHHFAHKKLQTLARLLLNDNSITSIEVNAFSSLPSLEYLDLSNNLLEDVPADLIRKNTKLIELNLSGNMFSTTTPELVSTSLRILDLSFSKISEFTETNLKGLPSIEALRLNANNLKHVDYNIFVDVKLQYVDLSFNSWRCHCDTIELFDYLVKAKLTKIQNPIQCMHPNKWYEDIYSSKGATHHDKLCRKKPQVSHTHSKIPAKDETPTEVTQGRKDNDEQPNEGDVDYKISLALIAIAILILISLISLFAVLRKLSKAKQIVSPENHTYEELPERYYSKAYSAIRSPSFNINN